MLMLHLRRRRKLRMGLVDPRVYLQGYVYSQGRQNPPILFPSANTNLTLNPNP